MLYMSSQMGNDGSYQLSISFDVDVDLNTALVTVQNRVTEAMPQLPTPVQNQGITIRKKTPDQLLMINFISANDYVFNDGTTFRGVVRTDHGDALTLRNAAGKKVKVARSQIQSISAPIFSDIELSNFALVNIKDEILRVDGVADASIMGDRQTLKADAFIPAVMALIYLLLLFYFKAIGGYKPVHIDAPPATTGAGRP